MGTGSKRPIKLCLICGDKAFAFNFGVISCQSCKAFFRRNALKNKGFECAFDNNCRIDKNTRKFCQKCRLDKCFTIGMKKEWILNEEQLGVIKAKILYNKIKKSKQNQRKKSAVEKTSTISSSSSSSGGEESESQSQSSGSGGQSPAADPSTAAASDLSLVTTRQSLVEITADLKTTDRYLPDNHYYHTYSADQLQDFHEYVVYISRHVTEYTSGLNGAECTKLVELFNAINFIREPTVPNQPQITDTVNLKVAMVRKLDTEIRRIVTVAQNVTEFGCLCDNDRIALIKYGVIEIICMRLIQFYNFGARHWTIFMEQNKWILSKLDQLRSRQLKQGFSAGFAKIGDEWDSDPIILDLLTVILLFDPNRPNLINKECIKLHQNIYMYLLQRYLILKYKSENKSRSKFLNLMNALIDINTVGKVFTRRCYLTDPKDLGPILREILDVKLPDGNTTDSGYNTDNGYSTDTGNPITAD